MFYHQRHGKRLSSDIKPPPAVLYEIRMCKACSSPYANVTALSPCYVCMLWFFHFEELKLPSSFETADLYVPKSLVMVAGAPKHVRVLKLRLRSPNAGVWGVVDIPAHHYFT